MSIEKTLERHEGFRGKPYKCTAGKWTIGIGRNLEDNPLTIDEAQYLLRNDIERVEKELDGTCPWWRNRPQDIQDVMVNMCFQLGLTRFLGFRKAVAALERRDYKLAAKEMLDSRWATQCENRAKELSEVVRACRG